ncbi:hypothetical protein C8F04DRAFT_129119 [Mycena alexandri]|uniref:Uncharacterized protein n=1 Tax=Mycena alexandri TaxID=1745969 RepID=A0AAD6SHV4_9AGAR|nr:hypothetical protein C8F04DRAFT_129119 [Mycena alexandri]
MASIAPAAPATQLCDYCHQKPKHGTHAYCSKTCAAQIATLCNYCQKKPKYQNFDFCGKNCAALGAAAAPASGNRTAKNPPATQVPSVKTAGRGTANAAAPQAPLLDPVYLAKLVVQHIPQVQSFLAAVAPAQPAPPAAPVTAPMPMPANSQPKPPPRNNPFLNQGKQQSASNSSASNSPAPASSGAAVPNAVPQAPLQPLDCLVPGCGQPVHVDASGAMSDYCSKKHREEAVALGLVPPCIMCLMLPQSDTDYFCGRECREEAMSKAMDP